MTQGDTAETLASVLEMPIQHSCYHLGLHVSPLLLPEEMPGPLHSCDSAFAFLQFNPKGIRNGEHHFCSKPNPS